MSSDQMESEDSMVRDELHKWAGFHEVHRVKSYLGYPRTSKGHSQEVTIRILDLGPIRPDVRFGCTATSEDGKFATGNGASTIQEALSIVHWDVLDRDE